MREFTNRGEVEHRQLSHVSAASTVMRHAGARRRERNEVSLCLAEFLDMDIASFGRRPGGTGGRPRGQRD